MKAAAAIGLATALGAKIAAATDLPGFLECNGYRRPNYDDCDNVIDFFDLEGNDDTMHENGEEGLPEPSCKWWFWDDGNCRITHCYLMNNGDAGGTMIRTGDAIAVDYKRVKDRCTGFRAGGSYFEEPMTVVDVFNDEDEGTASSPALRKVKRSQEGFVSGESSYEDYLEWRKNSRTHGNHGTEDFAGVKLRDVPESARRAIEDAVKRDGDDDDEDVDLDDVDESDEAVIVMTAIGVRNPDAVDRGPRLSPGVGYEYSVTESTKFTVKTSVEMGASWNIFTASAGIETTQEDSFSITEGLKFDVTCKNRGQVSFYPFYDYYEVQFGPSWKTVEIWVPVASGKYVDGEIGVDCLG